METPSNPFVFGALAIDDAFTDREAELAELAADMRNGQDVVVFAPRRYGKSSLVLRAMQQATARRVLVGYCDLMKTPTKERFAAALATTIHGDLDSKVGRATDRAAALFRGLRLRPTIEVDPEDGTLRFLFQAGRRREDLDDTIVDLLALPGRIAAERKRRTALVFDEFQEIVSLDPNFPNLMRAVFQTQPEVGHIYLGSKRHILERIFNDKNEPFWRSAKRIEIGVISPLKFRSFLATRFEDAGKGIDEAAIERLLDATAGHPYATQELAYFVWELVPPGHFAFVDDVEAALTQVLRSEHSHFTKLWDDASHQQRLLLLALVTEVTASLYSSDYRARHGLPDATYVQRALGGLIRDELVRRTESGEYVIAEPFLAEWLQREQAEYLLTRLR